MGTATRFWNWTAERYSRQAIADEASYHKKLAMTQKYLAPDMRVVEFGCGTGSTAILHAPVVKTYHAIDVSEKMIEIARAKAAEAGLSNISFTVGTLEEANAPDALSSTPGYCRQGTVIKNSPRVTPFSRVERLRNRWFAVRL